MSIHDLTHLLARAERVLTQLEAWLPPVGHTINWQYHAFRWVRAGGHATLRPIKQTSPLRFEDLLHLNEQTDVLKRNTQQFLKGHLANNILMTGARGTGKSSLIRALLNEYAPQGLRLIEVEKDDLVDLPLIIDLISSRPERFIIFADDLSFEANETNYKGLKSVLEGSLAATHQVLVYATSNRRHLVCEKISDNLDAKPDHLGDIHPGESIEEKISLSDRFGIWLPFYPFNQDDYLSIVAYHLTQLGCSPQQITNARFDALQWATQRGSRSGRTAAQFAREWITRDQGA